MIEGADKEIVGQVAAEIRSLRPPEPYKGKGIKYAGRADPPEGRQGGRQVMTTDRTFRRRAPSSAYAAPLARAQEGERHRRASAPRRVPLAQAHLRAARRRRAQRTLMTVSDHGVAEGKKTERSAEVGKRIAAKAKEAGITKVVFDRAGYEYHGRVKAVADGAREGGLEF